MSSSVNGDNNKKDILIFGEGPAKELDEIKLTAEKKCLINFTASRKKFCLYLHYNAVNSNLFVNGVEIIKFKVKGSEINAIPLCLGNISKDFLVDNMRKTGLNGYVYDFSYDYDAIAVHDILYIYNYLMKKHDIKCCLDMLEKYLLQQ